MRSSTFITIEYFFTFVPLLYFVVKDFENLNTSFIVMGCVYLFLLFVNINMFLYFDFKEPQYNNFKRVRIVSAGLLQLVAMGSAPLLFFLDYKDDGLLFINQYNSTAFFLGFLAMIPAKLLGYDTEFGSKKAYKRGWLKLVFLYISLYGIAYFTFVIYIVLQNESKAIYFTVLFLMILISSLGRELAVVLLPWSNDSEKSIIRDWNTMIRSIRDQKKAEISKSRKNGSSYTTVKSKKYR